MKPTDSRFFHRLRVRWSEVDIQHIVFNAHYLTYVDTAITAYWRALGLPYHEAMALWGGDLYVKKATVEFHASARLDDSIDVGLTCARIGNSSLHMHSGIFRGDTHLISADLIYVFADPNTQTSRPVPQALRDVMMAYEAGEDVITLRTADWAACEMEATALRREVFATELGLDPTWAGDADDPSAVHVMAYNRLGQTLATGRYVVKSGESSVAQISRLAVQRAVRGSGLGRDVVGALLAHARAAGCRRVVLNAPRSAQGFYQRLGFVVDGEPFEAEGIVHVPMRQGL